MSYVVRTSTRASEPLLGQRADRRRAADAGHAQVHEDDVGLQRCDERERLGSIGGLADDVELGVAGEHAAQAVADDGMVVDDERAGSAS